MSASTDQRGLHRERSRAHARPCFLRSALAIAVSVTISGAYANTLPGGKIRLTLNDTISSRVDTPLQAFEDRLTVNGLIQSHPHELYVQLEEKYRALPPFTQATEAIAERYIVEATPSQKMLAGVKSFAGNASQFVPTIRSSVRHDDINGKRNLRDAAENPTRVNYTYTAALATVNPTFLYETETRKWRMKARYDYVRGRYFIDEDSGINDHTVDINWTRRLNHRQELSIATLYENTHDRSTSDPIEDFDSTLESSQLDYNRTLVNLTYRNGTLRDRTRYAAFLFRETSSVDSNDLPFNAYDLNRTGIGGNYAWQVKKQISLVAEGRYSQLDYDFDYRDNKHFRALVGTDMIIGRRIRAIFRVGYEEKSFEKFVIEDTVGEPVWHGELEWALRRKTSVRLETGREIYELATVDQPIDASRFNVQDWVKTAWTEQWTDKLSTETAYTYRDTSFKGRKNSEDASQFSISAVYDAGSNLKFAIDGAYTKEEDDLGYDLSRRTITFRTDYSL